MDLEIHGMYVIRFVGKFTAQGTAMSVLRIPLVLEMLGTKETWFNLKVAKICDKVCWYSYTRYSNLWKLHEKSQTKKLKFVAQLYWDHLLNLQIAITRVTFVNKKVSGNVTQFINFIVTKILPNDHRLYSNYVFLIFLSIGCLKIIKCNF